MYNISKVFIDLFDQISNRLSLFSKTIKYEIFVTENSNDHQVSMFESEINFIKIYAEYSIPETVNVGVKKLKEKLINKYDNCIPLHINRELKLFNEKLQTEIGNLRKERSTSKILRIAQRIRKHIQLNPDFEKYEKEFKEIQIVTQFIDAIIEFRKDYRNPKVIDTKLCGANKNFKNHLEQYIVFLDEIFMSLIRAIGKDKELFEEIKKNSVPNLCDPGCINPFFMYLTFRSIDARTLHRIIKQQEYYLYWINFKDSLIFYKDVHQQKKVNNRVLLPDHQFSPKITPMVLEKLIELRDSCKSPKETIEKTVDYLYVQGNYVSESYIRRWITLNSSFYDKFKRVSVAKIVDQLEISDIEKWYKNLCRIDRRFISQLDDYLKK